MSMQSGPLWEGMTYLGIAGRRDARTHPNPQMEGAGGGDLSLHDRRPCLLWEPHPTASSQPRSPPELLLQVLDAALQP